MIVRIGKELVDDGLIIYNPYSYGYRGADSGFRSCENDTKIHKQATSSRIDEVKFGDIRNNKDYYEIHKGNPDSEEVMTRYYNLCVRCGYVPNDKQDVNNTKYLDMHCKCGNPITLAYFTEEEINDMNCEDRRYARMYKEDNELINEIFEKKNGNNKEE